MLNREAAMPYKKLLAAQLVRPAEGGIKRHVLTLLDGFDRERIESVVICPPNTSLYEEVEKAGYEVVPLDLVGELNPAKDLKAAIALRRILRDIRPDVLHIHSTKAALIGRTASLGIRNLRVLVSVHSFVFDERVGCVKRAIVGWVERRLARRAERIIVVSGALKKELVSRMRLPEDKIEVVYNGIAPVSGQPCPETTTTTTATDTATERHSGMRIGTVSRLAPQKGVDVLLRSAALLVDDFPKLEVVIVGDGPLRGDLEELARELGISDRVKFLGFRSDALSIVAGLDVFVLSSTRETFGMTLAEAMSLGVPVVASRTGGIPEVVDDEHTGLLAEPGNPCDFASKVRALASDKDLARTMAERGRTVVRDRFGSAAMVSSIEKLYFGEANAGR